MQSMALLQKTAFVHVEEDSESQQYREDVRIREQKCQSEQKEIGSTLRTLIPMTGSNWAKRSYLNLHDFN